MVDQFRVPTLIARRRDNPATTDGWITEAVAGMIAPGETAEQAIIRETLEETGYRINKPELICKFFSSPGGTSERIFLYFSEVSEVDRVGAGGRCMARTCASCAGARMNCSRNWKSAR